MSCGLLCVSDLWSKLSDELYMYIRSKATFDGKFNKIS